MNDAIRDVMIDLAAMTDDGIERLKTPWSTRYWSYATNGKMAIRFPRLNEFGERRDNDHITDVIDSLLSAAVGPTWYDIPAVPPAPGPCPKCHGVPAVKCEACDGDGAVEWEFEHDGRTYDMEAACPVCDGESTVECNRCGGSGVLPEPGVEVGPALIRADFLRLMARLPGCQIAPVDGLVPVVFEFDGAGRGAVMPMRR